MPQFQVLGMTHLAHPSTKVCLSCDVNYIQGLQTDISDDLLAVNTFLQAEPDMVVWLGKTWFSNYPVLKLF